MAINLELIELTITALPDSQRESVARYVQALQRARQFLAHTIDAYMAVVDRPAAAPAEIDIAVLLQDIGAALQPLVKERHVRLEILRPPAPVPWRVERETLRQQVLERVLAQLDVTVAGGRITVELSVTGGRAVIRVHDPDAGTPPTELEVVLAPENRDG